MSSNLVCAVFTLGMNMLGLLGHEKKVVSTLSVDGQPIRR